MSSLHRPHQVDSFPHVDVAVQGTGVSDLVLGAGEAEDGLKVAGFAEDAALGCEGVAT